MTRLRQASTARWVVGVLALVVLAALAWRWGWVNRVLPERMHYGYAASRRGGWGRCTCSAGTRSRTRWP